MKKIKRTFIYILALFVFVSSVWIVGGVYFEGYEYDIEIVKKPLNSNITDYTQLLNFVSGYIENEIDQDCLIDVYFLKSDGKVIEVVLHYEQINQLAKLFYTSDGDFIKVVDVYINIENKIVEEISIFEGVSKVYKNPYINENWQLYTH